MNDGVPLNFDPDALEPEDRQKKERVVGDLVDVLGNKALKGLPGRVEDEPGKWRHNDDLANRYPPEVADLLRQTQIETTKARSADAGIILKLNADKKLNRRQLLRKVEELIDLTKERDEWKTKASQDPLTGIPNRRGLEEMLGMEVSLVDRVSEGNLNLYFLMIDADYFKKINDTYGHDAGDLVLKELAWIVSHRARKADFVARRSDEKGPVDESVKNGDRAARLGGEEFGILAWCNNDEGARVFAEGIRELVKNHKFIYRGVEIPVTVSIGVAKFPKKRDDEPNDPERIEKVIAAADAKAYEAKKNGRDRVEI